MKSEAVDRRAVDVLARQLELCRAAPGRPGMVLADGATDPALLNTAVHALDQVGVLPSTVSIDNLPPGGAGTDPILPDIVVNLLNGYSDAVETLVSPERPGAVCGRPQLRRASRSGTPRRSEPSGEAGVGPAESRTGAACGRQPRHELADRPEGRPPVDARRSGGHPGQGRRVAPGDDRVGPGAGKRQGHGGDVPRRHLAADGLVRPFDGGLDL